MGELIMTSLKWICEVDYFTWESIVSPRPLPQKHHHRPGFKNRLGNVPGCDTLSIVSTIKYPSS